MSLFDYVVLATASLSVLAAYRELRLLSSKVSKHGDQEMAEASECDPVDEGHGQQATEERSPKEFVTESNTASEAVAAQSWLAAAESIAGLSEQDTEGLIRESDQVCREVEEHGVTDAGFSKASNAIKNLALISRLKVDDESAALSRLAVYRLLGIMGESLFKMGADPARQHDDASELIQEYERLLESVAELQRMPRLNERFVPYPMQMDPMRHESRGGALGNVSIVGENRLTSQNDDVSNLVKLGKQ